MKLLWYVGLLILFSLWPSSAAAMETKLIAASDQQLILEVAFQRPQITEVGTSDRTYLQVRSLALAGPTTPGLPDLPIAELLIALPPGTEAVASVISESIEPIGVGIPLPVPLEQYDHQQPPQHTIEFEPNPSVYDGDTRYPEAAAHALPGRSWRQWRIAPLRVAPVTYDPVSGRLYWRSNLRLLIQFVPTAMATGAAEKTSRVAGRETRSWERLYENRIINSRQARQYKQRTVPSSLTTQQTAPAYTSKRDRRDPEHELSIRVDRTAVYRLPYEQIAIGSLDSQTFEWSELSLWVRDYTENPQPERLEWQIHFTPADADSNGQFGPGDGLIFFGQDGWEFFGLSAGDKRYGRSNIYWLEIGDGPDGEMRSQMAWLDEPGLTNLTSFTGTIRYEENRFYGSDVVSDDTYSPYHGPFAINTDHYNWTDYDPTTGEAIKLVTLDLPYATEVNNITVRLQGQESMGGLHHQCRLWFSRNDQVSLGQLVEADTAWAFPDNPYRINNYRALTITLDEDLPASSEFGSGRNYLKLYLPWKDDGFDNVKGGGAGIDWVDVTYRGKYQFLNNHLEASVSGFGIKQVRISRLATKEILAFDVTDRRQPVRLALADSMFSASGSRWNLTLQMDLGEIDSSRQLYLIEIDHLDSLQPDGVKLLSDSDLLFSGEEDVIAIYPRRFSESAAPLLDWRESQGHQVLRATTESVYNAYSGGRRHPFAIKRMLRHLWRESRQLPDYLLLIGDGSVDLAGHAGVSDGGWADSSFVPIVTIPGFSGSKELVASDHWFIDNLAGDWGAPMTGFADLFVGRIPCGTEAELTTYVDKLLAYEQTDLTGNWRSRVFMHSDDGFSSLLAGLGDDQGYMHYSIEDLFERISLQSIDYIREEAFFSHIDVDRLFQSDMDSIADLGRCVRDPQNPSECQRDDHGDIEQTAGHIAYVPNLLYGQDVYKTFLIDQLSTGGLIWAYQGHSNKKLLTHEYVFQHANSRTRDVFRLMNLNKPFLFLGAGCHLGEFAHSREAHPLLGGDAMAEVMLFCCPDEPKGAIAVYGSTDFEAIGHRMEQYFFRAMFATPPEATAPLWRPGNLMVAAKLQCTTTDRQRLTYSLLGDPALRMSFSAPVTQVAFNEIPWTPDSGHELVSHRENDSLSVRLTLQDESRLTPPTVTDHFGVVSVDSLIESLESAGGRKLAVTYHTRLQRKPYTFSIDVADGDGNGERYPFQVPCDLQLFERRGGNLLPLGDGDLIEPRTDLELSLRIAAHMSAEDVSLYFMDEATPHTAAERVGAPGEPSFWTFSYSINNVPNIDSAPVTVAIRQHDGTELTLLELNLVTGEPDVHFNHVWWIPSPFSEQTTLVYELSQRATRVRLRLYSASGRCFLECDSDGFDGQLAPALPVTAGVVQTGAPVWNGRDQDGDQVANGLYFYELTAWDQDGKLSDQVIDKLVRFRTD
jgi:Peptidase family C25/Propeptide_C25